MTRPRPLILAIAAAFLAAACGGDAPTAPRAAESTDATLHRGHHGASWSRAMVLTFDGEDRVGWSLLRRSDRDVRGWVATSELEPGTVVTLWLVVFNKPQMCTGPCDEPDLFDPAVMADVLYGNGRVIGHSGRALFTAHRHEGDASGSIFPAFGLPSPGLMDARTAEVHYVVRTHGPKIRGLVREMRTTFGGGCNDTPPELGTPGPNTCEDIQFSVHVP